MNDLRKRALTAIGLVVVLGAMLWDKGWILRIGISLLYVVGLYEWHKSMLPYDRYSWMFDAVWGSLIILWIVPNMEKMIPCVTIGFIASTLLSIIRHKDVETIMRRIFAIFYILCPLLLLTILAQHAYYGWLVFILSFGSDTCAYFTGAKWGSKKLAPTISPNKSIEGALGALVGTALISLVLNLFLFHEPWSLSIVLGLAASLAAQTGDLLASMFKRHCQIKDFGWVLPGHGGILDRFDSILLVSPLIYAVITLGV